MIFFGDKLIDKTEDIKIDKTEYIYKVNGKTLPEKMSNFYEGKPTTKILNHLKQEHKFNINKMLKKNNISINTKNIEEFIIFENKHNYVLWFFTSACE